MTEWILSSSLLIIVVLVLRALLGKKISAGLRYGLWAVVIARLLVPVSFITLPGSVPQIPAITPPDFMQEESVFILPVDSSPIEESGVYVLEDGRIGDSNSFGYPKLTDGGETVVRYAGKISPLKLLGWIWAAGAAAMGLTLITANLRFFIRLRRVRKPLAGASAPIPVYTASGIPSPCLVGLLRPAVYATDETASDPAMLRHVLAHELTHYIHFDHLWSVLRGAALAVHWWNPLVWLAVVCSRRDGELACDEGALKRLGDSERTAYGETLLTLVTAKGKPGDLLYFATTMTGGKRSLKERVQRVAQQPKRLVSASVAAVLLLALVVVCAFGVKEADGVEDNSWQTAEITIDESGVPHIHYYLSDGEKILVGKPVPAPQEWADQDVGGRNKAAALEHSGETWAKLVSPNDGWLVACYGRGVAAADTYVYKTTDGGMTWTEATMPGTSWHIADVGFLNPERLIVAQRFFDGAPCLITTDGGKTWKEIALPEGLAQVLSIAVDGRTVTMQTGYASEGTKWVMTSHDLGDTWETTEANDDFHDSYASDHPDDVDSVLNELLMALGPEDLGSMNGDVTASELARLLNEAVPNRLSRFHEYSTFAAEGAWAWSAAEWAVPLADGGTLHLLACDSGNVEIAYETADKATSAFYESDELYALILKAGTLYPEEIQPYNPDLDRDGEPDELVLRREPGSGTAWSLQCRLSGGGVWRTEANTAHVGWNAVFLRRMDGQDCLLRYQPYMSGGICSYQYQLFYLEEGREVAVQENSLEFDINFGEDFAESHHFDPQAVASFMDEINTLLADSVQLLNTDGDLLHTFEREGRLYDSLWWLDEMGEYPRADGDLLAALEWCASSAGDHHEEPEPEVHHEEPEPEIHYEESAAKVHHTDTHTGNYHH